MCDDCKIVRIDSAEVREGYHQLVFGGHMASSPALVKSL